MTETCSFKLDHYKYCLELAKKNNYSFLNMHEYIARKDKLGNSEKIIVLRHDIDYKLKIALNPAKIEHGLGISATYFIRLHSDYNVFSYENYKIVKELLRMKHELGLHYDCDFADLFGEDNREFLKRDIETLERMLNRKTFGVSSHEPKRSRFTIDDSNLYEFGFEYRAYSDMFLKEMKYISDSSCRWREGCMCNFFKKGTKKLCILTHPIWWFDKSPIEIY